MSHFNNSTYYLKSYFCFIFQEISVFLKTALHQKTISMGMIPDNAKAENRLAFISGSLFKRSLRAFRPVPTGNTSPCRPRMHTAAHHPVN